MPFIDSKITEKLSAEKKERIKAALGSSISALNKSESYLMVGISDNYDLWMAGEKLNKGAYVEVSLFGSASPDAYENMTAQICKIFKQELDIEGKNIYVTYHPISDWGWNGRNF